MYKEVSEVLICYFQSNQGPQYSNNTRRFDEFEIVTYSEKYFLGLLVSTLPLVLDKTRPLLSYGLT